MAADVDPIAHAEALIAEGRPHEAAFFLRKRLDQGRGGPLSRLTMTRAFLAAGATEEALEMAQETAALNPQLVDAVLLLARALFAARHLPTAIAEAQRALRLDPSCAEARQVLAQCWLEAGEADKALEQLALIEGEEAAALTARVQEMKGQQRSDPGYVRHLFDQFSADYDVRMREHLHYRAPEILRELADLVMPGAHALTMLDLGCGTGFAAEAFRGIASTVDGIDLSPRMIAKARDRQLYRDLAVADIEAALAQGGPTYDLILAADTLVYLGDLSATVGGIRLRLRDSGWVLFTVERSHDADFELGPKRRWCHSEPYLRRLADSHGFDVRGVVECSPRTEAGVPIDGFAVALAKMP